MIVAGEYSFNRGQEFITANFPSELVEVRQAIANVDSTLYKTKTSREKTMLGRLLYNPAALNAAFKIEFAQLGWRNHKIPCQYSSAYYTSDYMPPPSSKGAFREIDFVKNRLGLEVQFGKYAFMVYDVCAKMTIFRNQGVIAAGIEIVPVKQFADEMSSGVSYFEQFVWDLEHRGVADIDVPVLILGITI